MLAPRKLLVLVYKAKLAAASPAFATLVLAMVFLCVTVVLTVYLLGVGWRWVVLLLAAGTGILVLSTIRAHGAYLATARADLFTQAGLALALALALAGVHRRSGRHWSLLDDGLAGGRPRVRRPHGRPATGDGKIPVAVSKRGKPTAEQEILVPGTGPGPPLRTRYRGWG